ncbi:MAG: hypothetical protein ACRD0V_18685 [Acidimicrobiales bacterium]
MGKALKVMLERLHDDVQGIEGPDGWTEVTVRGDVITITLQPSDGDDVVESYRLAPPE